MVKKSAPLVNSLAGNPGFKEAVDALCQAMRYEDLANELDCSASLIKGAIAPRISPGYRKAPAGWEVTLRRLLEARADHLAKLAARLRASE